MSVAGKTILVTGGARRIGRAISLRLAAEGARVAIHYGSSADAARSVARECGGAELFQANLAGPGKQNLMAIETQLRADPAVGPALAAVAESTLFTHSAAVPESSRLNPIPSMSPAATSRGSWAP